MEINPQGLLTNLLLKNQLTLNIPQKEILKNSNALKFEVLSKANDFLTVSLDKEHFIKIPLVAILEELDVKATADNLIILKKLLENKLPLSKDKFTSLSKLLGEIPQNKEEFLDLLFNPLLKLIIINDQEKEKTFICLNKENVENKQIELTILFQHPKTEEILIKILWDKDPIINMYFINDKIKELFASRINQLKERLAFNYYINCYSRKKLPVEEKRINYYKIDLKI